MAAKLTDAALAVEILKRVEAKIDEHINNDSEMFRDIRASLDGDKDSPGLRGRINHLELRLTDSDIVNFKVFRARVNTIGGMLVGVVSFLGWDWIQNFFTVTIVKGGK